MAAHDHKYPRPVIRPPRPTPALRTTYRRHEGHLTTVPLETFLILPNLENQPGTYPHLNAVARDKIDRARQSLRPSPSPASALGPLTPPAPSALGSRIPPWTSQSCLARQAANGGAQ
ncbi:hypothetical protein ONZ51_g333 [Trametes cubensis]|uniref:Uncharacterized protein n=1 Tax=Trametes cubensis TaxID=1111947 RepID=A0AAD7U3Q1_9APHY|nr:hypothetical protein ONZ51_g333 [Trametes cubensis]